MTETDRDNEEIDAICAAFAMAVPEHERAIVAFRNALLAAHNRQVLASLARQLRAGGLHAEVDGPSIVLDLGPPQEAPILQRVFTAVLILFRNRRRRAAIPAIRP